MSRRAIVSKNIHIDLECDGAVVVGRVTFAVARRLAMPDKRHAVARQRRAQSADRPTDRPTDQLTDRPTTAQRPSALAVAELLEAAPLVDVPPFVGAGSGDALTISEEVSY